MKNIDEQFVEFIIKSLVNKPDAVKVVRTIDEKGVLLELTVDPEDLGRVIGKRGATAQSIRTLLRALGTKNDARYNLKIVDNGAPRYQATSGSDMASEPNTNDGGDDSNLTTSDQDSVQSNDQPIPQEDEAVSTEEDNSTSDRILKARQELQDLDDLDV
jgi:hypothetical protein